jgi:hypothetical protein
MPGEIVMNQRLYFLLPDREHAQDVISQLKERGVNTRQMHTLAGKGLSADGLPASKSILRDDLAGRLEFWGWRSNLALFFISALTLVAMLFMNAGLWMLLPVCLMVISFLLGERFTHLPNTHLGEFADALKHGEILLMIDIPSERANEIEHSVQDRHPEAVAGGSSWNTPLLGT